MIDRINFHLILCLTADERQATFGLLYFQNKLFNSVKSQDWEINLLSWCDTSGVECVRCKVG